MTGGVQLLTKAAPIGQSGPPPTLPALSPADAPFAIGITGHRLERLAGIDLTALAERVAQALAATEAAAPVARFRLVGALAEGADTIAADVALARGWRVDAILPFAREEYARDFEQPGAAARFRDHLTQANCIFELPGERDESGGPAAYERAGRVMLAQSDLLLAIWDGDPPRGRGGAAQIVVEAVGQGVPVLTIHPDPARPPELLWSGLNAHEFGPESVDTVARGGLADLSRLFAALTPARDEAPPRVGGWAGKVLRPFFSLPYPLLLAATGVRQLRLADLTGPKPAPRAISADSTSFDARIGERLLPWFDAADHAASIAAQLFRGAFVSNFALAALSVTLSLLGLVAPLPLKPVLVLGEFASISVILLITHIGGKAGWHGRWLHQRRLAERLRCLAVAAPLGELLLRDGGRATGLERTIARALGLPSARVDAAYLAHAHASLVALLDDQIGYLEREAGRMNRLEHRLHRTGGVLFSITAAVCVGVLVLDGLAALDTSVFGGWAEHLPIGVTVVSATLPAIGAAIYGVRMQGDFSGAAERNQELAAQLAQLRRVAVDERPAFDGLRRLARRTAELLAQDVSQWFRASLARPLTLPG